jgi:SHS2 domain-containing protein
MDRETPALAAANAKPTLGTMRATHSFAEHVGELAIQLEAASLAELFAEAARALSEVMLGRPPIASGAYEHVWVKAPDREALLVAWLDELIFRAERDHKVYGDARVDRITDEEIDAAVRGEPATELKTQVKAATFHDLQIADSPQGVSVTVVLDV